MQRWVRILAVALLAAFSVGSVVHAASATTMSVTMALADHGAMDMADCDACCPGPDESGDCVACDAVCLAPLVANLGPGGALSISARVPLAGCAIPDFVGRTGQPEPFPPRNLV